MSETDIYCPECGQYLHKTLDEFFCYNCHYQAEDILEVAYKQNKQKWDDTI